MEQSKLIKRFSILIIIYSVINIFLIALLITTRVAFDQKIRMLEKKIEIIQIHVFPEEEYLPPETTSLGKK